MRKNNIYLYYFIYFYLLQPSNNTVNLCYFYNTNSGSEEHIYHSNSCCSFKNTGSGIQWYKSDWHLSLLYK